MRVIQKDLEDPCLHLLVCGYTRILPNHWNFSGVSLPFWRFYWNRSPGASIQCHDQTIELTPDVAVLMRPNAVFSTVNCQECGHLYIHFQMAVRSDSSSHVIRLPMTSPLLGIGQSLLQLVKAREPVVWQVSMVARSLVTLATAIGVPHGDAAVKLDPRVLKVISYMEAHLKPSTSNADLAREARMSSGALNQLFKQSFGYSLQAYLRIKRIEKAALMLQFSDGSIEQIAEETGFCDRYHFSRVFRSLQGISPAAFRSVHANPFIRLDS